MAEISGAQLVIDSLRREGVDTIYVLPGDPVGDIVNGWADAGHKAIAVRHEQAACMAAQALPVHFLDVLDRRNRSAANFYIDP